MKKHHVTLTPDDRAYLKALLRKKGQLSAKRHNRALALLELDSGATIVAVATQLRVSRPTVIAWAHRYRSDRLKVLEDHPRPGRPIEIDGSQRAKVTALACSTPPEGHAQWSWRLLADKVVELGYCDHMSHTEVGLILKKTNSNRT